MTLCNNGGVFELERVRAPPQGVYMTRKPVEGYIQKRIETGTSSPTSILTSKGGTSTDASS